MRKEAARGQGCFLLNLGTDNVHGNFQPNRATRGVNANNVVPRSRRAGAV